MIGLGPERLEQIRAWCAPAPHPLLAHFELLADALDPKR